MPIAGVGYVFKPVPKRQLYRALHKLECRQAARRGAALMPLRVMDLEV